MTVLYAVCLVGLFCSAVMVWKARYNITTSYAESYKVFTDASDCITDVAWGKVLTDWILHTSFVNFGD